jgi:hypothetical protein
MYQKIPLCDFRNLSVTQAYEEIHAKIIEYSSHPIQVGFVDDGKTSRIERGTLGTILGGIAINTTYQEKPIYITTNNALSVCSIVVDTEKPKSRESILQQLS